MNLVFWFWLLVYFFRCVGGNEKMKLMLFCFYLICNYYLFIKVWDD